MKILHVTLTPLAGAPIRLSDAINSNTEHQSRVLNLNPDAYGNRKFKEDFVWGRDNELVLDYLRNVDIVHFHHFFEFESVRNPFGLDFKKCMKSSAKLLMHWHTNPYTLAFNQRKSVEELVDSPIPQLVVAQFHESYYPNAYPVPLVVSNFARSVSKQRVKPLIFYSPSNSKPAFAERWETKGRPETLKLLKRLKTEGIADYVLVEGLPFDECMKLRENSDIVIDDLVTGSFHTTSLESMAMGKPTISYVDSRTQAVLANLTGSNDLPIVNVNLKDSYLVLRDLCLNTELRQELAQYTFDWMNQYYSELKMVNKYIVAYKQLQNTGTLSNERYADYRTAKYWLNTEVPDLIWKSRRELSICLVYYYVSNINYWKKKLVRSPIFGPIIVKFKNYLGK